MLQLCQVILAFYVTKSFVQAMTASYMCEKPEDALKFTYVRGLKEIIVLTIDLPDDFLVEETFDHSYKFFQCKSFGTLEPIPSKYIKEARKYEF